MILYLDSSAAVKVYSNEQHSQWTRVTLSKHLSRRDEAGRLGGVAVASITYAEIRAALAAKLRAGALPPERHDRAVARVRAAFERGYAVRPVLYALVERAGDLAQSRGLRGYDAVQLAVALGLRDDLVEAAKEAGAEAERRRRERAAGALSGEALQGYLATLGDEGPPSPERVLVLSFDNDLHDAAVAEGIAHARPDREGGERP